MHCISDVKVINVLIFVQINMHTALFTFHLYFYLHAQFIQIQYYNKGFCALSWKSQTIISWITETSPFKICTETPDEKCHAGPLPRVISHATNGAET